MSSTLCSSALVYRLALTGSMREPEAEPPCSAGLLVFFFLWWVWLCLALLEPASLCSRGLSLELLSFLPVFGGGLPVARTGRIASGGYFVHTGRSCTGFRNAQDLGPAAGTSKGQQTH
eukprot:scaffold8183_cov592-Prasinococcus_capsulatus_cf.AAC.1